MSLSAPVRRLPIRCLSPRAPMQSPFRHQQHRTAASSSGDKPSDNPVLDEYKRKAASLPQPEKGPAPRQRMPAPGDIAAASIFEDQRRLDQIREREETDGEAVDDGVRDPAAMARTLIPDPRARQRWQRKKVIQMVRKSGRLTKEEFLKRTEREHLAKSHNLKTSVKKLGMVARQIAGKTVDDAIVQMRFSHKKVAQDVLKQLELARDEAIVARGMGLGALSEAGDKKKDKPIDIQLKDGKRHNVTDRTKMYVDQAWVGRGPYGKQPDYRARGRVNMMRTPWTSISLVLKEEATRVREWEEREAKRRKRLLQKVWVALPDRPIQIQRQWYSW